MSDDHGETYAGIEMGKEIERGQCMKDVCPRCSNGEPAREGTGINRGEWFHDDCWYCPASPIRSRVEVGKGGE